MADNLEVMDVDPSVGFLYKAMLERDPKKRRVKPVQKHLLQLDFGGLDDSSDDSDFEVPPDKEIESGESDDGSDHTVGKSSKDDIESSDSSDQDSDRGDSEGDSEEPPLTVGELIEMASLKQNDTASKNSCDMGNSNKLKVLICCVCLGDISEEDDEIVECDGCGVSVHEGCYGIGESQSIASTESSASTEPWFCDACKAGVQPHCELCPNPGGIYKETDAGRWVHLVCALYIPGVAFGDVDKLSPVTLFEMPYNKWGSKECCLCEDSRFSRTAVCIGCDAGMCRNYFHVTCAQREGLLSEASPDEDIADPFYAYCKQHADKHSARAKCRNWLAIQSHYRNYKESAEEIEEREKNGDETEKFRVQRKLKRHREKYALAKAVRPPSWVPQMKMPRLLTTSASAVRRLLKKAELLGINTQVESSAGNNRKKWHIAPAFTPEYVGYYLERNSRINNMKSHLCELVNQREKLQEQEHNLRMIYDNLSSEVSDLRDSSQQLRLEGEEIWDILSDLAGKPLAVPEVIKPKKPLKSPKKDTPRSPPAILNLCGICKKNTDQHLLAKCDKCKQFYHLGCLNPPLSRMPKKTKLQGWQCSECVRSSSELSEDNDVNPDAPRRLREKIKEPVKFTPPHGEEPRKKKVERKKKSRYKKKIGVKRSAEEDETEEREMPVLKREYKRRTPRLAETRTRDVRTECACCNTPGTNGNLVRCDDCQLCYHFHCLDPPMKKTPKQRGYTWHCAACDPNTVPDDFSHIIKEDPADMMDPPEETDQQMEDDFQTDTPDQTIQEATQSPDEPIDLTTESRSLSPDLKTEGSRSQSPQLKNKATEDSVLSSFDSDTSYYDKAMSSPLDLSSSEKRHEIINLDNDDSRSQSDSKVTDNEQENEEKKD